MIIPARKPDGGDTHAVDTSTYKTLCGQSDVGMLAARADSVNCPACVSVMAGMAQSSDRAYTLDPTLTIEIKAGVWRADVKLAGFGGGTGEGETAIQAVEAALRNAAAF